jgi:S1-C subfamily serine protease
VETVPDSPAAKAGLKRGDIIVRWEDEEIVNAASLILLVSRAEIGSTVKIQVFRGGEEVPVEVTIEERPPSLFWHAYRIMQLHVSG